MLATGSTENEKLLKHSIKVSSAQPIELSLTTNTVGKGQGWLVQIHAVLMALAWMGSAASGMVMARYYKKTWRTVRPLGMMWPIS